MQQQRLFAVNLTMVRLNPELHRLVAYDLTFVDKFLFCTKFSFVFLIILVRVR